MAFTTVSKAEAASNIKAKQVLDAAEARFDSFPKPYTPSPNASAGELLLAAKSANTSCNPGATIREHREFLSRGLKEAKAPIIEAKAFAEMLHGYADAIRTGRPPPPETPDNLAAHAAAIQAGAKAGLVDPATVAAIIDRAADEADRRLVESERQFRRFESAGAIASAKHAAAYYRLFDSPALATAATALERKAENLTRLHRARFFKGRPQ